MGAFIHLAQPLIIKEEPSMHFIKRKGTKAYFYYSGDLDFNQMAGKIKNILKTKLSAVYIFELFPMYKGMTDFSPWLTPEMKDKQAYYNQEKKELSAQELQTFKQNNGL